MLALFEGCVANEDLALFAPDAWLEEMRLDMRKRRGMPFEQRLTADFQYSAMMVVLVEVRSWRTIRSTRSL